jgi:hypothetical protein
MSESQVDKPVRGFSLGRLVAACTLGGVAVGIVMIIVSIVELSKQWALGYTGMFGEGYSVALISFFAIGGGALFGALAGLLATGGVLVGQAISRHWLPSAIGASVGAVAVGVLVLVILRSGATAPILVAVLVAAIAGPFAFVALCSRRSARTTAVA